jgi:hypothetical protein
MAYCIRCGVKLAEGSAACPLCKTEVILPPTMEEGPLSPLFSRPLGQGVRYSTTKLRKGIIEVLIALCVIAEVTVTLSLLSSGQLHSLWIPLFSIAAGTLYAVLALKMRGTYATQASLALAAAAIIVLGLDGSDLTLSWSLIVVPALAVGWIVGVLPALIGVRALIPIALALLAYPYTIGGASLWFVPIVVPVWTALVVTTAFLVLLIYLRHGRRMPLADVVLAALGSVLLSLTVLDLMLTRYVSGVLTLRWSLPLLIAAVLILLFLLAVSLSRRLRRYFTSVNHHS